MLELPAEIRAGYGLTPGEPVRVPSLINRTFVTQRAGERIILQRLHATFGADVNLDLDAVTQHLLRQGFETPTLVRTQHGDPWLKDAEGHTWRALTFIAGRVIHAIEHPDQARSAAALLGRFHLAVAGWDYTFRHVRTAAHDTANHLRRLREIQSLAEQQQDLEVSALATAILEASQHIRVDYSALPRRITHGDLKISNILFWDDRPHEARCLIDLDTLGYQYIAYELGDALRSWCNPQGETAAQPKVDLDIFQAALLGYASPIADPAIVRARRASPFLSADEVTSIVEGLETICIELSSRFAIDALEDRYFGWDDQRFTSRREHNLVRATGQLALFGSVHQQRDTLLRIANDALRT
ncbi:MAG TPA: phosphotransferase [Polyangiaceae bacterium]|nr:phosphotransferase [Polyangiaceae bacterium]